MGSTQQAARRPREPVQGMTGVGSAAGRTELGHTVVEVRSVNGRGFAAKLRLADACMGMEMGLEQSLRARVRRGSLTLIVEAEPESAKGRTMVDEAVAAQAVEQLRDLATRLGLVDDLSASSLLAIPGVLDGGTRARASVPLPPAFGALVGEAVDALVVHRLAEGEAALAAVQEGLAALETRLAAVRERAPQLVAEHRARLLKRVNEFLDGRARALSDQDVLHEVALFADRVDVSEELQRLAEHLRALRDTLERGGEVGRTLEFLLQEVLREVNTLGSKSPDVAIAHDVVAMKSTVEKLKEQAANLE